ncbi:hypothetical protein CPB86DRAFT_543273 [Serendipita vermifera]|nr:hypothetical protein CPB86DRAFT_543273 [Serendipita vermifera]
MSDEKAKSSSGYLPLGVERKLTDDGNWDFVQTGDEGTSSDLPYEREVFRDAERFPDDSTLVQIVTFDKETGQRPQWYKQHRNPNAIKESLSHPLPANHWRWIHCEGMHGATLKAVAEGTGWDIGQFAEIFVGNHPAVKYKDGRLIVRIIEQDVTIYIWQGTSKECANNVITCSSSKDSNSFHVMRRLFAFVDHGCAQPKVILHKDPSLMYYGVVRAVIHDMRFKAHYVSETLEQAYDQVTSRPSSSNLATLRQLQSLIVRISLDTSSLMSCITTLANIADNEDQAAEPRLSEQPPLPPPIISQEAKEGLEDQMGSVQLLLDELPFISNRADSLVSWTFNMLSFQNNNLLQLLSVVTLASLPLTVVTGILGINYFDDTRLSGERLALILGIIGGIVMAGLIVFLWFFVVQHLSSRKPPPPVRQRIPNQTTAELLKWSNAEDRKRDLELARERHGPKRNWSENMITPNQPVLSPIGMAGRAGFGNVRYRGTGI